MKQAVSELPTPVFLLGTLSVPLVLHHSSVSCIQYLNIPESVFNLHVIDCENGFLILLMHSLGQVVSGVSLQFKN